MRGHDKEIFVAHKKNTASNTTVISNDIRTPLSYEDVVDQHHSFRSAAVVQLGRRGEVDFHHHKKNETFHHLQRCGDHFFGVLVAC